MLFLIEKNIWLLLITLAFAGLAGWAWQGLRSRPKQLELQRERERLLRDVLNSAIDGGALANGVSPELEREMDTLRRRADLDAARIAEMERALEAARDRAEDAAGQLAEMERAAGVSQIDTEEMQRLREELAELHAERARTVTVEPLLAAPAPAPQAEEDSGLRWRLRYFEQRVRYLEGQAAAQSGAAQPVAAVAEAPSNGREALRLGWRARYAEARARHLEQALREAVAQQAAAAAAPEPQLVADLTPAPEPQSAEPTEADELMRWRMIYLEKRLAYVEAKAAEEAAAVEAPEPTPEPEPMPVAAANDELEREAERLKWRTRYLESRLRKMQAELVARPVLAPPPEPVAEEAVAPVAEEPAPQAAAELPPEPAAPAPELEPAMIEAVVEEPASATADEEPEEEAPAPLVPAGAEERPAGLPAARGGAPDDFTLIDDISPMLQSTLNSLGVYHFEQIAAWTPANVAWLDQYLRLRGRIAREEWIEQADDLAREGPAAARRLEDEMA